MLVVFARVLRFVLLGSMWVQFAAFEQIRKTKIVLRKSR